jgi:hypothetical protein
VCISSQVTGRFVCSSRVAELSPRTFSAPRINGGTNETDEALLDGISIVDGSLGQNGIELAVTGHPMSPEAIQEITLLTSNYDAQYGYTSSSVLTAITKSGTNAFHGTLYELLRNTSLNARPFGVANRPIDKENDFGGNIGGPIKLPIFSSGRKKSYFFVNYEGFRLRGASSACPWRIDKIMRRLESGITLDSASATRMNGNLLGMEIHRHAALAGRLPTRHAFDGDYSNVGN